MFVGQDAAMRSMIEQLGEKKRATRQLSVQLDMFGVPTLYVVDIQINAKHPHVT